LEYLDASVNQLIEEFIACRDTITRKIGVQQYEVLLKELREIENERLTAFTNKTGVIDYRKQDKKDMVLNEGFYRNCGVKGSRLSGG